ncbi:origin recognition complex subunit 4 C-terminus-domain-containing protein [Aspergillus flavus]|uniref:Origin recognition complex subunit 4 n=2 Tax=Aspergillus subgen. Circumdati TaxID=2720871 RepID=A0A364LP05_ASPFL|nr:origin recognition complex, subunit 4 [Aspergillus oryzae 3.042]KAB8244651.1 origin recognition complex subunit 4 C-terminus-domain-containing protein [Aspergillus flavus]KDE79439.1 origin recognition complex [Aspergillus oryzae 100-8]RAQ55909.1 origin recognition complex subunit Orc4 [Aspergillus flavus]RAQ64966.1 origin recognition complex subunit Orc4 [Aspergillus flavus]|eukprot:EIT78085.1 origin recognition complex, subunit 4 [Aspergillus oryzae 3.042]
MKESRASKRRRVSDAPSVDGDGDVAMGDGVAASPTPQKNARDDEHTGSPTASRSARRRASKGGSKVAEEEPDKENENGPETPSRPGLRSSGRQRKAPQRYEDEVTGTPASTRRAPPASGRSGATPRSTRKARHVSEDDDEEVESPQSEPQTERLTRTRSRRPPVRFTGTETNTNGDEEFGVRQSPSPDEYQDGLDDLVSMQLQQDLAQNDFAGKDETVIGGETLPAYAESLQTLSYNGLTAELGALTTIILDKLTGKRCIPLKGLESEYDKVHQLVEQTVSVGEGNSLLLLGSRGSGKTAIVETIISSLKREHHNDFHVVRLNGFLHTDDRLALREMWRQLGRETNTEEEAGKVSSYADTMATLLALLSHPEELFGASNNTDTVTAAKSIVIILDEFDLFVTHPRQTLLYNLFDIAQARKAPIAVLGLTTKVDVTEMLEKRVKSRFSHRYVYVPLPRSLEGFSEICRAGLDLEDKEVSDYLEEANPETRSLITSEKFARVLEGWRAYLQGLWSDEAFQAHLRRIFFQTRSAKEFFTSALIGMTELHYSTYDPTGGAATLQIPTPTTFSSQSLSCPDPGPLPFSTSTTTSASPSSLPLSLLLAATRLAALYDPGLEATQPQSLAPLALSFPAAYAEYVRLLTFAKTSASVSGAAATPGRVWGRDVAREAWEKLISWGLISPVGGGSGTADGRMFRVEISFEEVVDMAGSGGSLGKWWRDG